jgi:beta-lactamase regulating signal transducer with metallopeptidase domain
MADLIGLLNGFGQWLFGQLWQVSVELAVLGIVVTAVIALLKPRSAALRHLFWSLLLAKPVVALLIASPISLYWFLQPAQPTILPARPVIEAQAPAPVRGLAMPQAGAALPQADARTRTPVRPPLDRYGVLALVWLCGSGAMALRLVSGFAFIAFLRRAATPVHDGPLHDLLRRTSREAGVRVRVGIALSSVSHGPVLAGIMRPTVLIPQDLAERLPEANMRAIIAHELAHAHRRDNLVLLAQRLVQTILFFHPVIWLGGAMMRREAEAACDDAVLRQFGNANTYADSLTRVAEMRFSLTQRLLVNTFAAAETHFARRLRRILHNPARPMTVRLTLITLSALVLISCFGLPRLAHRDTAMPLPETALLDSAAVLDPEITEFTNSRALLDHVPAVSSPPAVEEVRSMKHISEASSHSSEIELFQFPSVRLIGRYVRGFSGAALERDDAMMETLRQLPNVIPGSFVGWVGDYQPDGTAIYIFGIFAPTGTPCPDGFVFKDIAAELSSNVVAKGAYGEGSCMPIVRAFERLGYESPYCGIEAYGWWEGELYLAGESPDVDSSSVLMPVRPIDRKLD